MSIFLVALICKCLRGLLPNNLGIGGSFTVLTVSGLSDAAPKWRRGVSGQKFGCSLTIHICNVLGLSLLDLILSSGPSIPGRRSISCVCCKVEFLCGMISFTTDLTRWVDRSEFHAFLIDCFDCVDIVGNLVVGVRICITTVIVVVIVCTIRVLLGSFFLWYELKALV